MGDFEGRRRSSGYGDGGRAGEVHGTPGKTTRVAELQRKVNDSAHGAVTGAFGPRAQGVEYAVGGGAADARGAHAVAIDGKVDFAPGRFDVDSREGRARLGEETAHAVQQSNPGAPASIASLEGEAKQAGLDFAAGVAPHVELAAPSGVALADDPKDKATAVKDTDPSPDVPDLLQGEVTAIQKVLTTDQDKALALLLTALQRIDASKFSSKDLTDKKLHTNAGTATTVQGPAFRKWLETSLDNFAKKHSKARRDLSADEIKAAIHADPVPASKKDITVEIGSSYFKSISLLYSSVRHEFVHVEQMRADYLGVIPDSIMPTGTRAPDAGTLLPEREVEAYLWEMENVDKTGLKDPGSLYTLWDASSNKWNGAGNDFKKKLRPRYKPAFVKMWKLSMSGHVAAIGDYYKIFKKDGTVPDADTLVYTLQQHMKVLWDYGTSFDNDPSPSEKSYKAALKQSEEILGNGADTEFKKALDAADAALKAGVTSYSDAFDTWFDLANQWYKLDPELQKTFTERYKVTGPKLWDKAFSLSEAEINRAIKAGDAEAADTVLVEKVGTLFKHADKSFIKAADYAKRRTALEDAVKKAKKP